MGNLPQVEKPVRTPLTIELHDHLADHHFMGTPVLPAVEAMEILSAEAQRSKAITAPPQIRDAQFNKFLPLDLSQKKLEVYVDRQCIPEAGLQSALITRMRSPKAAITRTKEHARVSFPSPEVARHPIPMDVAAAAEGIGVTINCDAIYRELVPFGPAYRNITAPLWVTSDGALAAVQCPDLPSCTSTNHLGSPFALDAAFHAACVWGQHYFDMVAFPVAVERRTILQPTQPGRSYWARVIPQQTGPDLLVFDLWLLDHDGRICEIAQGVHMRDVSAGRLKPPDWIRRKERQDPLAAIRKHCNGLTVVELQALAPFAKTGLSTRENDRFIGMGERRKSSYLGARMALKRLSRNLSKPAQFRPAHEIETLCNDSVRPQCSVSGRPAVHCSVSHNRRFAVAAAAQTPIGIDVETIAERAVKCRQLYMSDLEQELLEDSALAPAGAAVRIWSIKEAVAKAHNINLAEAWQRAEIETVGETVSRVRMDGGTLHEALHTSIEDSIITVYTTN